MPEATMPSSAVPDVTKRNHVPKSVSSHSGTDTTAGIRKTRDRSFGTSTTPVSTKAKASVSFPSATGQSWMYGSISILRASPFLHSTSPKNARLSNTRVPKSWLMMNVCPKHSEKQQKKRWYAFGHWGVTRLPAPSTPPLPPFRRSSKRCCSLPAVNAKAA